ncbi:MAG: polysaccharide export protein [Deferrisomatales bacterium]|nr:polysaccharide export protein [Deferrisomatales bacterium]
MDSRTWNFGIDGVGMRNWLIVAMGLLGALLDGGVAGAADAVYRLGPGDVVEVSVWRDESLTRELVVPPDGVLSFPLIGDIDVTDLTVPGLREVVEVKLAPYVPEPTVAVILLRSNSLLAYVLGKVNKPGQFSIAVDTTVVQLLAMAGGPNPYASAGKILVLRQSDGTTQKISFDYDQVAKGERLEQNIILRPGDVVLVP